jgi:hypothetical protein
MNPVPKYLHRPILHRGHDGIYNFIAFSPIAAFRFKDPPITASPLDSLSIMEDDHDWDCAVTAKWDQAIERRPMNIFFDRMIRAAKLQVSLYEEVEADRTAMGQAMGVVVLSGLAAGIGAIHQGGGTGFIFGILGALGGWFVWAYLTYFIGTRLLPTPQTHADSGQLLRTIGFSSSPGIIRVLGIIPGLAGFLFLVAGIWMLVAMVIAVRQALDYDSTLRAVGVCLIGWIVQALILALLFALFGHPGAVPAT